MLKQAQSATEFLTMYAWAIFIVLAGGIAMYNYGLLEPEKVLPTKCILPAGIICLDSKATSSGITVVIRNGQGYDMRNVSVGIVDCGPAAGSDYITNGDKQAYTANCELAGSKFKGSIDINYIVSETEIIYTARGTIITRIEY